MITLDSSEGLYCDEIGLLGDGLVLYLEIVNICKRNQHFKKNSLDLRVMGAIQLHCNHPGLSSSRFGARQIAHVCLTIKMNNKQCKKV